MKDRANRLRRAIDKTLRHLARDDFGKARDRLYAAAMDDDEQQNATEQRQPCSGC
ncbi:MAG TPA: hypothetical protein VH678_20565 [Xanthobacteraceae bacterium]|jgi:hypothetical protein